MTTRGPTAPRDIAAVDVAFRHSDSVGTPKSTFRGSIARPARAPVNASPPPSQTTTHDSGPPWVATPFDVELFHLLLHAGLSRRSGKCDRTTYRETRQSTALTNEDRRALTPLFWAHVAPYGEIKLDMRSRLTLNAPIV